MKCPDAVAMEVDILCYNFSFLFLLKANCNFQKRGLKDFVQHFVTVAEVDSRTIFCTILKLIIGLVPIGEGPGDIAQ